MYQYTEAEHEAWLESQTDVNDSTPTNAKSILKGRRSKILRRIKKARKS